MTDRSDLLPQHSESSANLLAVRELTQMRQKSLIVGLLISAIIWAISSKAVINMSHTGAWQSYVYIFVACTSLLAIPFILYSGRHGNGLQHDRIAAAVALLSSAAILSRIADLMYGGWLDTNPDNLFRPIFAELPVLYTWAFVTMRGSWPQKITWGLWLAALLIIYYAMWPIMVKEPLRDDIINLNLYLLLANPMILLALGALPRLEILMANDAQRIMSLIQQTELANQLTASERRFDLVVQSLQVGVWDIRLFPKRSQWWSAKTYSLLGKDPNEFIPTPEAILHLYHPDDIQRGYYDGLAILKTGHSFDADVRLKVGTEYRWFNITSCGYFEGSRLARWVGAIEDIHDKHVAFINLREAEKQLRDLAYRDGLTGLQNRRAFDDALVREWDACRRQQQNLALLLIDLDHFKNYNDSYGHPAGDQLLRLVGSLVAQAGHRAVDVSARVGGEEFAVLLPHTPVDGALHVAEKLRISIAEYAQVVGIDHPMTASMGVAICTPASEQLTVCATDLYERADKALYASKTSGRNRITVFADDIGIPLKPLRDPAI